MAALWDWIVALTTQAVPLVELTVVVGCVALGGVVGSFLNVVVHRVPRGESVVFGGSRCPACGAAVRPRDNLPVLGWLLLRGRCRDCDAPISPRYPLVEAACAAIVGLVAAVELLSGGRNLPHGSAMVIDGVGRGIDPLLFGTDWRPAGFFVLHCGLLVTLLSWSLFEQDGRPVPRRLVLGTLAAVAVACLVWPWLQPVAVVPAGLWRSGTARGDAALAGFPSWLRAIVTVAAGGGTGWVFGRTIGGGAIRDGLMVVGAVMGWQAALQTGLVVLVVRRPWNALRGAIAGTRDGVRLPLGEGACLLVAATVVLCSWRLLDGATEAACRWVAAAVQAAENGG